LASQKVTADVPIHRAFATPMFPDGPEHISDGAVLEALRLEPSFLVRPGLRPSMKEFGSRLTGSE
jgi:hypothetical protein